MIICKDQLDHRPDLRKYLFCRGFLITDQRQDITVYPFYGNWTETAVHELWVYAHNQQKLTIYEHHEETFFLIGHAYNPYSMQADERGILETIATAPDRQDVINQLTGVFFLGILSAKSLQCHIDCSGMQPACYGLIRSHLYISSHMRLIGDLLNLRITNYADRLIHYRWYPRMMGNYLPGDITCFSELTRIIPNTYITYEEGHYSVTRFYPVTEINMCRNDEEYNEIIREGAGILRNTMTLISRKWERPAISLTGGIDSNTTFAAADGLYDRYTSFSYVSMPREDIDARKAEEIAGHFQVPWKRYDIPETNKEIPDYETLKSIINWNGGGIGENADNDIRKKIVLIRTNDIDVEVKSWVSETVRAYAYKYFGRTSFPANLSARNYTALYKLFFLNRRLARETDEYFRKYWQHTRLKEHLFNYDESDFFVWEMMHGGKCGLDIGVMKTCFDITIPYNNRKLLDLLLRVPLEKRLSDQLHLDLKKQLNRELYDMNIRVVNANETNLRKKALNAYFTMHSRLPF